MKKIILTAAAVATLASSTVFAAEDMFYVKGNIGWNKMSKIKGMKSNNVVFFGAGVGYNVMDNVRVDLTFDHFVNPTHKKNFGADGSVKVKGEVNTLLVNGFVDLFDVSVAKVFAGAGVGLAQVSAKVSDTDPNPATNVAGKAKKKNNLAYAGYLGASTEFAPGVNGELVYSYRGMGKTKKTVSKDDFDYKGHNIGAGVRFDL